MARTPREHVAADGTRTWRVRFRAGNRETSETFRRKTDADTFAAIMGRGQPEQVAEALAWLAAKDSERTAETFGTWFDHYVEHLTGVSERTRDDYKGQRRRYLTELDTVPLPLITRTHVASIVNRMDRDGRAPKTIKQAIHLLSTVLQRAVDEGQIPTNPCRGIRLPAQARPDSAVEARFLTHDEAARLIAAMPAHYKPLTTFLFGTGVRISEATALQTRHVDLAAGTVRIDQAWKRVPGGDPPWQLGPPKTRKSRRTVNAAVPALLAVKPLLGKPKDFVFTTTSGGPVRLANFYTNVWRPACERAGFGDDHPRIHDTRHTHASWLISDGMSLEQVQDQLGHESILTTRNVYGHLLPALGVAVGRSASAAMKRVLKSADAVQLGSGPAVIEAADQS